MITPQVPFKWSLGLLHGRRPSGFSANLFALPATLPRSGRFRLGNGNVGPWVDYYNAEAGRIVDAPAANAFVHNLRFIFMQIASSNVAPANNHVGN